MTLAVVGIAAKVGLFVWVDHTTDWTVGTSTLTGVTAVLGVLTMVLALIDFGWSRGHWLPLLAFILGLLTFAPVIGFAA
jgi:ABC-type Fe3+-siderophore transport system permease subunit